MNQILYQAVQFDQIKAEIVEHTLSDAGRERLGKREPSSVLGTVEKRLGETAEAVYIRQSGQHVPFMGLKQIQGLTEKVRNGSVLEPEELTEYEDFLRGTRMIQQFFAKNAYHTPILHQYTQALPEFRKIEEQIDRAVSGAAVKDDYTRPLRKIRQQIRQLESDISDRLQQFLRSPGTRRFLQDALIMKKNERYTIPVKAEFRSRVSGSVIESSAKGATVFIEPQSVARLTDELFARQVAETAEVYQILAALTGSISERLPEIAGLIEVMTELDMIFARAQYSLAIGGRRPEVNKQEQLHLCAAKHPLLGAAAVPLDLSLGEEFRALVITGANAGGKTVALKTVALLTLLTMFGVLIPCQPGTKIAVFDDIFIDIGDNQSLENSLSTFSAHMQNLSEIIRRTKRHTLVLLDEIGSGTDPKEGAALGMAALDELYRQGGLVIATTHYGEIKEYARRNEDFTTAAMAFDRETLTPYYRLLLGETGESGALLVAGRMGLPSQVLTKARKILQEPDYQTVKQAFAGPSQSESAAPVKTATAFAKGDRVGVGREQTGLFYDYQDEHTARVYADHHWLTVPLKSLRLLEPAARLYPADYEVENLFEDFALRKQRRDLERGSKKAQKRLDKERKARHQPDLS